MRSFDPQLARALAVASSLGEDQLGARYFQDLFFPLLEHWAQVAGRRRSSGVGSPLVVSLSGLPGTGKSTFARLLQELSEPLFGLTTASLSLDDVYLTQAERRELAKNVHPLLVSRGVPGTHDLGLFERTLSALVDARSTSEVSLPRFDKLADERAPRRGWPVFCGRPDLFLADGWFWGTEPGPLEPLGEPLNDRERDEDPDGSFRSFVHGALAQYQDLFGRSEEHVHFEAPSFEGSVRFRILQGQRELGRRGRDPSELDPARTRQFLELFQRVGTWPRRKTSEWIVSLDEEHRIVSLTSSADPLASHARR